MMTRNVNLPLWRFVYILKDIWIACRACDASPEGLSDPADTDITEDGDETNIQKK